MANQLGSLTVAPKSNRSHVRHARFARIRHALQTKAFLSTQATRLSSTSAVVFAKLAKYKAATVKAAANLAAIP